MSDSPSPPPPTPRRSYLPLGCAVVGALLGGLAMALFYEHFRDEFGGRGTVWQVAPVGAFSGFCLGFLVGGRVAALWKR